MRDPAPRRPNDAEHSKKPAKQLFARLRGLDCATLWRDERPRFDAARGGERTGLVAVVRAVGSVFAARGSPTQQAEAIAWLRRLLDDADVKVRRYAASALATLRDTASADLIRARLRQAASPLERDELAQALGKLGDRDALADLDGAAQRQLAARLARTDAPASIDLDAKLTPHGNLVVLLRWRHGYEPIVAAEAERRLATRWRVLGSKPGRVALAPPSSFALRELFTLRCFDLLAFAAGTLHRGQDVADAAALAAAPHLRALLPALTRGALRYRVELAGTGHQRAAVRRLVERLAALWPELLNDPSQAPWTLRVYPPERGGQVEWQPHIAPDPRLLWRVADIPAASHPRMAAAMVQLAGPNDDEVLWDPCCGSGVELVERGLRGGVRRTFGTDTSEVAIAAATQNLAAAGLDATLRQLDFRAHAQLGLSAASVSLILTNPPMGRRVPQTDVHRTLRDLFAVAAHVLRPGGRLVLPNPLRAVSPPAGLALASRQAVDFGGFEVRLEVWRRG